MHVVIEDAYLGGDDYLRYVSPDYIAPQMFEGLMDFFRRSFRYAKADGATTTVTLNDDDVIVVVSRATGDVVTHQYSMLCETAGDARHLWALLDSMKIQTNS